MSAVVQNKGQETPPSFLRSRTTSPLSVRTGPSMVHPRSMRRCRSQLSAPRSVFHPGDGRRAAMLKTPSELTEAPRWSFPARQRGMEAAVANFMSPEPRSRCLPTDISPTGLRRWRSARRRHRALGKAWGETYTENEAREFIGREKPKCGVCPRRDFDGSVAIRPSHLCRRSRCGRSGIADCVTSLAACRWSSTDRHRHCLQLTQKG